MLGEAELREALGRLLPEGAGRFRSFAVSDGAGRMRIGTLCTDAGWYAEVSNFQVPPRGGKVDYCAEWEDWPGVFRFGCEVDLFYSDIEQIMSMSRSAAEAALAAVAT